MKPSIIRVRHVLALGLLASSLLVACSKQEEGQRCSTENDDNDCEGNLICVPAGDLRNQDEVPRCCPPEGSPVSDGRCTRLIGGGSGGSGGSGNLGGQGGEAGTATSTSTSAGTSCAYDSECPEGFVCGPGGVCQSECRVDRDCEAPLVCNDQGSCVSAGDGSAGGSF